MEIIVSQTGRDGRRRAPGFLPGLTLRPHIVLFFFFFSALAPSPPPPPSNCPEECLFSGIRAQARQCVSFSKGMGDWQGHDLLYFLGPFVIPRRGRGHGELPWRRSALSSSQPSLASTETFLLFFFFFLPRPPSAGDPEFLMGSLTRCSYAKIKQCHKNLTFFKYDSGGFKR